ncbi:transposase [Candidatus Parcubacteria bacterium]|nr:transposase [Candidatus Parcubacteria bacterium]
MRNIKISPGEYYHICNRGINKQIIFHDHHDYLRFLFLILYFQSPIKFDHLNRIIKTFSEIVGQHRVLATGYEEDMVRKRSVELTAFCIMPNHFHLLVKEIDEGGIAAYMQRVLNAYGKYYNTKYGKSGHVFQGPYRAVHMDDDTQLLHVSAYIHRNAREIGKWQNIYNEYPWSSCQDFTERNRWGKLVMPGIILDQFKGKTDYKKFLDTSLAKVTEEELAYLAVF